MVLELASLMVRDGEELAFEQAFARAEPLLRDARGYLSHELRRSVENVQHYALLVEWRQLEDHTMEFMRSLAFERLRLILRDHLRSPPEFEHFRTVMPGGCRTQTAD